MIQIKVKNPLFEAALMSSLSEFDPQIYDENTPTGDILILLDTQENVSAFLSQPLQEAVVLLGTHHQEADLEIDLPCSLNDLKKQINLLIFKQRNMPIFENDCFLFEGVNRLLINKKTAEKIRLTEKETRLISFLVCSLPESVSKADLLREVWHYNPDTETHTVETHIYGLRQKMGEAYFDSLISNTGDGYVIQVEPTATKA